MLSTPFIGIRPIVWLIRLVLVVAAAVVWADVINHESVPERTVSVESYRA
jgi:hypothetical protein